MGRSLPLPATKENVDEIRLNVIRGDRSLADLKKCGCPACLVAMGQLKETKGVRMVNAAITHYEKGEDTDLIDTLYELRDLLQGVTL